MQLVVQSLDLSSRADSASTHVPTIIFTKSLAFGLNSKYALLYLELDFQLSRRIRILKPLLGEAISRSNERRHVDLNLSNDLAGAPFPLFQLKIALYCETNIAYHLLKKHFLGRIIVDTALPCERFIDNRWAPTGVDLED